MIDYLYSISYYLIIIAAWLLGGAWHLAWTFYEEYKKTGQKVSVKKYRELYPYKLELGLLSAISALLIVWSMGQMNIAMAVACGYMGDSIASKFMNSLRPKS